MKPDEDDGLERIREKQAILQRHLDQLDREIATLAAQRTGTTANCDSLSEEPDRSLDGAELRDRSASTSTTSGHVHNFSVSIDEGGETLNLKWNSSTSEVYTVVSSKDPENDGPPENWSPVAGLQNLSASLPVNRHSIRRPADSKTVYRLLAGPASPLKRAKLRAEPPPLPRSVTARKESREKDECEPLELDGVVAPKQDDVPATFPATEAATEAAPEVVPKVAAETGGGLEMKLGTYWLVRVGILMLLTGFVFLAKYFLTSNEVSAGLKVASLYVLSASLLGVGFWIGKTRETMRNYGEVLAAGGFAAVYFTTFAAHKVPGLDIISSPLVAGILMLSWAAVMVYTADRKQSQTLAVMGVLLAYYTLLIDQAVLFSLFSALILSGAALIFLLRNRWTIVGSCSLGGTYLAFAYWRFPELLSWLGSASPASESFWPAYGFLICYWATFSAAVFLSDYLAEKERSALAGLNNAAFLVFFGLGMGRHYPDQFWLFSLIAGFVFLLLSGLSDRRLGRGTLIGALYLTKGLVLITLAFFMKLSGFSLAVLIAAQSCVLLVVAVSRRNKVLEVAAHLSACLAVFYTVVSEAGGPEKFWFVEFSEGIPAVASFAQLFFLVFCAWWSRNRRGPTGSESPLDTRALFYLGLGVLALLFGAYSDLTDNWRALVLVGLGACAALLGGWRRFKLEELGVVGQVFSAVAAITFLMQLTGSGAPPVIQSILVLVLYLGLVHWAAHTRLPLPGRGGILIQWLFAVVFVAALPLAIEEHAGLPRAAWVLLPGLLALALTVYGYRMRITALAVLPQTYHLIAAYLSESGFPGEHWLIGFCPLVLLLLNIILVSCLCRRVDMGSQPKQIAQLLEAGVLLLRILALVFFGSFVHRYVPVAWQASACSLAALVMQVIAIRHLHRQHFVFGLILLGASALLVLSRETDAPWIVALLPLVLFLGNIALADNFCRRVDTPGRPKEGPDPLEAAMLLLRILALVLFGSFVHRYVPVAWQASACSLAALALHVVAIRHLHRHRFVFGLILLGASVALLFRDVWGFNAAWQAYLVALMPMIFQQISRQRGGFAVASAVYHRIMATAAVGLLWLLLSIEVRSVGQGFYVIASWAILGVLAFVVGWFLRERIYRILSLLVVGVALGRLLIIDVWGLDPIARILTFILIGFILLALGFIYTRYQDKLRRIF